MTKIRPPRAGAEVFAMNILTSPSEDAGTFGAAVLHDNIQAPSDGPTNEEFLTAVLHDLAPGETGWVTQFHCPPDSDPPASVWDGTPWTLGCDFPWYSDANSYASIASFPVGAPGRQIAHVARVHCVIADDIGTKCPIERLKGLPPPNWILVTSFKSHQYGWIFTTPVSVQTADRLHDLIQAGQAGRPVRPELRPQHAPALRHQQQRNRAGCSSVAVHCEGRALGPRQHR